MTAVDLHPAALITAVDAMGWADLERHRRALLAGFRLVAEAPGAQLRETMIARSKSGASAPRATPVCSCGCPSQLDHWSAALDAARDADLVNGGDPLRTRDTIFRAAEDLYQTTHSAKAPRGPNAPAASGPERDDYICRRYRGIPARRAAHLESLRAGEISVATLKKTRLRNGYGGELGEPQPAPSEIVRRVVELHRTGMTDRAIAREVDIGREAVAAILAGQRTTLGTYDGREAA
ncbi:hypothetical protein [Patulibacter sp. SYSU D01012]|uniref:hypothetical protein n=1 Tax=Patulibacter sp. SYSU D01012 TaxID=2817381 RepID=UPI001B307F15|nr:hypothetical protein [Patulibacter sp. SYSU D01012]